MPPPARGCLPKGRRGSPESRSLIFISADYCGHQSSGKISATKYKFLTICLLRGQN